MVSLRSREEVLAEIQRNRARRPAATRPQAIDTTRSTVLNNEEASEGGGTFGFLPSQVRAGFSAAGTIFSELDRPLSERIGFKFRETRGPLDEIGNFLLEEATRPTNLLFAVPAAGASVRLGRSGSRLARVAGTLLDPVTGATSSLPTRIAGETIVSAGSRAGSELAAEAVPEDAGLLGTVAPVLAGGLVGGLAGVVGARHALRPFITDPVIRPTDLGDAIDPHPMGRQLYGHEPIRTGLSAAAEVRNALRAAVPFKRYVVEDAVATPAKLEWKRLYDNAESVGSAIEQKVGDIVHSAFRFEPETFLIKQFANEKFPQGVTLSTLMARRPLFERQLTDVQRRALAEVDEVLAPYHAFAREVFPDMGMRADVMEGGSYITRGNALGEDWEAPSYVTRGFKGKPNFTHAAEFDSPEAAIAAGYRYESPEVAIGGMVRRIGRESADHHVRNYLTNVRDPDTGLPVAQTWRDRLTDKEQNIEQLLNRVRNRGRGYRDQMLRMEGQQTELGRTQQAGESAMDGAGARMARAVSELESAQFTKPDLNAAIRDMSETATAGRALVAEVTGNEYMLRRARADLSAQERALFKRARDLQGALDEVDNLAMQMDVAADPDSLKREYLAARRQETRIQREVDGMESTLSKVEERVDRLIEKGDLLKDRTSEQRKMELLARQIARDEGRKERALAAAEREVSVLSREQDRLLAAAAATDDRAKKLELTRTAKALRVDKLKKTTNELKSRWTDIKQRAMRTPAGQARIQRFNLDQYTFADEVAAVVNEMLDERGAALGRGADLLNTVSALNNVYRGMKASMDMSLLGIQALLGSTSDPKAYGRAVNMTMDAMFRSGERSERSLGMLLRDMDTKSVKEGLLSTEQWAANSLRMGGTAHEFELRAGFKKMGLEPRHWPLYQRADRAFGFAGDAMRRTWAEDVLRSELAKGKTVKQMTDSGEIRQIAESVNRMTGWTNNRFGGSLGDFILFAPRFLQSRLETVANAYRGLMPGAKLNERMARDAMVRFIGLGATATFLVNWALGEETETQPFEDGRLNPNFMRIRAFDRDFSLFGPWDSLLRMTVVTAQGNPQDAVRSMSSGTVTAGWDLISGSTFTGQPTRDNPEDLGRWVLGSALPFSFTDAVTGDENVLGAARSGDPTAAIGLAADVFGVKSAPMTPSEHRDSTSRQHFGKPWEALTGQERETIEREYPNVVSRAEEHLQSRADRGEDWAQLQLRREQIDTNRATLEVDAMLAYMGGEITLAQFADSIEGVQRDTATRKQELDDTSGAEARKQEPHWDALDEYYSTYDLAEVAPGIIDWDAREALEAELFERISNGAFGDPELARRFIDERRRVEHSPEVQWYFDAKAYISESGYYATRDKNYERFRERAEAAAGEPLSTYGDFMRLINRARLSGDARLVRQLELVDLRVQRLTGQDREVMRMRDRDLDAALVSIGRATTPIRDRR